MCVCAWGDRLTTISVAFKITRKNQQRLDLATQSAVVGGVWLRIRFHLRGTDITRRRRTTHALSRKVR